MTKNIIIFRLNVFLRDRPTVLLLLIESALSFHYVMRSFLKRGVLNKKFAGYSCFVLYQSIIYI